MHHHCSKKKSDYNNTMSNKVPQAFDTNSLFKLFVTSYQNSFLIIIYENKPEPNVKILILTIILYVIEISFFLS